METRKSQYRGGRSPERLAHRVAYGLVVLILLSPVPPAWAGVPQPGMTLYGKVYRGADIATLGVLEWTFTPTDGSTAITVRTYLAPATTPQNEPLSYSVQIPMELQVPGHTTTPDRLLLSDRPLEVVRTATLDGQPALISNSVFGDRFALHPDEHIGYIERVDLVLPSDADCCLGDADFNGYVNFDDYIAVRGNFGRPIPERGDADCSGFVNLDDYGAVREEFGAQCPEDTPALASEESLAAVGENVEMLEALVMFDALALPHVYAQETEPVRLTLELSPATPLIGQTLTVDVYLEAGNQPVALAGVFLRFDRQRLRFVSGAVDTSIFDNSLFTSVPSRSEPDVVSFSAATAKGVPPQRVRVATLTFTAVSNGTAALNFATVSPRETLTQDALLEDLPTETEGAEVLVQSQATAQLYLDPSIREAIPGQSVPVEVRLETTGLPVRVVESYVRFDAAGLQWNSGSIDRNLFNDALFSDGPTWLEPGLIRFRAASGSALPAGPITVATLWFTPTTEGNFPLSFLGTPPQETRLADEANSEIPVITRGGLVAATTDGVARLSLSPGGQTVAVGEEFQLVVRLDALRAQPSLLQCFLDYDTLRLRFNGGAVNRLLFDNPSATTEPSESQSGVVSFLAGSTSEVTASGSMVATLNFTALAEGEACVEFSLVSPQNTLVRDAALASIPVSTEEARITVGTVDVTRLCVFPPLRFAQRGDNVTAEVYLEPKGDPRFIKAFLHYEPAHLEFLQGTLNTEVFNYSKFAGDPHVESPGILSFAGGATAAIDGEVLAATLEFRAVGLGVTDLEFLLEPPFETSVQEEDFVELPFITCEGSIAVASDARSLFTFVDSEENWVFRATPVFDTPDHAVLSGSPGVLRIAASNSANTFGYWESPLIASGGTATGLSSSSTEISTSAIGPGDILTAQYQIRSHVADPARVPQFRLRATARDLQQSSFLILDSQNDGTDSPGPLGRSYSLIFPPMPESGDFTLTLDLLNFNPADDPLGDLELDWVDLHVHNELVIGTRIVERVYDFETGKEGWRPASTSQFAGPLFMVLPGALGLNPSNQVNAFGYWYSDRNDIALRPGRLYIGTFEVESSLGDAQRDRLPGFRCRLNETSLHRGAGMAVESTGVASRSPVAGQPQTYVVYLNPSSGTLPQGLVASFDLMYFNGQDLSDAVVKLNRLTIESADLPW